VPFEDISKVTFTFHRYLNLENSLHYIHEAIWPALQAKLVSYNIFIYLKSTQINETMKPLMLTLFAPIFCLVQSGSEPTTKLSSQDSIPNTAITLKDKNVIYQKVFLSDLKKEDLADRINMLLGNMRNFKFNKDNYLSSFDFFGRLSNYKFSLNKFQSSWFERPTILSCPINASVAIQVKDTSTG